MYDVGIFASWAANKEIVRFDVPVDQVFFMDRLHSA
jgi:hypothetical protein